ncbi:MAG: WD40/YVTN/BNR-like repeat-containing protein [Vicinamibacterales bacterium]
MTRFHIRAIVLAVALAASSERAVRGHGADAQPRRDGEVDVLPPLNGLRWRSIGPARPGGRVTSLAVLESNPAVIYVATASGGVWRTTNLGTTWDPLFDHAGAASIGDVAIARSDPDTVWVGTGEPDNRQSSSWGDGVYKSVDGGLTWQHMGLRETRHIGRVAVHPTNPDTVFVAALGHLWGPNDERGVFRSIDGGRTWQRVLFVDRDTGANDLVIDPANPNVLIAGMYQRRRTPWGFNGGGPGGGVYRSTDGGTSWSRVSRGLPTGDIGRIGLERYENDSAVLYARIEAPTPHGGVYRSRDRGESWEQMSRVNPRPTYFDGIGVDPSDGNRIYLLGRTLLISDDGGRTFREDGDPGVHSDHHAIWIDPENSNTILLGNDGGVFVSFDRSRSWRHLDGLPIAQFYKIAADMRDPYWICGGLQDNGSWCGPSATRYGGGIWNGDWMNVAGADGFYTAADPTVERLLYTETQNGRMLRVDRTTGERQRIQPRNPPGLTYRWNWSTPFIVCSHDSATLYAGAQMVLMTRDRGNGWAPISPDLTRAIDRAKLPIMTVRPHPKMLSMHDGVSHFGTITTLAESPRRHGVLYVGTDDGLVQTTRNNGATWTNVTENVPGLPARTPVSRLVASHHRDGTVYATFDGHSRDDYVPYVYASDDFGVTWRSIAAGLPEWSVNVIVEHPRTPDVLFVGTELGVYVSLDRGARWTRVTGGLPNVPVDDLVIHPRENDLIAGTHGRGIWILEDITPLERLSTATSRTVHVFPVRQATAMNYPPSPLSHREGVDAGPRYWNAGTYSARNPPLGARIRYYVREPRTGEVTLQIVGEDGAVLRRLRGPATRGIHEVVWDLRTTAVGGMEGPRVLPGTYIVRAETAEASSSVIPVRLDPLLQIDPAALQARQRALVELHELAARTVAADETLRRIDEQLARAREQIGPTAPAVLKGHGVRALEGDLLALRRDVDQAYASLRGLFGSIDAVHAAPRKEDLEAIEEIASDVRRGVTRLKGVVTGQLAAVNRRLSPHGVRIEPGAAPMEGDAVRPVHKRDPLD